MPELRSICLIPLPFTDLKSQKKRPVLILSNNVYNQKTEDVLVMALTSNVLEKEFAIDVTGEDMETGVGNTKVDLWIK
ncbi:MAG: type II toxin-antitoxin system PemK/MazF family toxin [Pseudomonadota bacterium]